MEKRIYLSAPALVCCAGLDRYELYESCLTGSQSGFTMRDPSGKYPVGYINNLPPETGERFPSDHTAVCIENTKIIKIIDAALNQLRPVVEKAILKYGHDRIGVCLGSCDIGSETVFLAERLLKEKNISPKDLNLQFRSASFSAEYITKKFGISGPAFTVANVCASGASAIMRAAELIRSGFCDAVIAGGADAVTESVFAGFSSLDAVSDTLTNPFSKNRKGLNLGEGAAFFLLDSEKNSDIELLGAGESVDASHMTAPGTDGVGPAKAMKAALLDAGIEADKIGYVNLHGTGTELNDKAEALAMKIVFKESYPSYPPVSSTKPITGHALGATGALEAAICWMILNEKDNSGLNPKGLPKHCWDGINDEEAPFSPPDNSGFETPSICMSNNFGFGGCNVSLIFGRC